MTEGYIYIENGVPVFNEKPRPDTSNFGNDGVKIEYGEWQSKCIEIENARYYPNAEKWATRVPAALFEKWITPGQKAFIEGSVIVKLG